MLGGFRPGQEALYEGGSVGDGHRAVIRDGQQLVRRHGESVAVATVTEGADGEVQEVELLVCQSLPENVFVSERAQSGSARRGGQVWLQNYLSC